MSKRSAATTVPRADQYTSGQVATIYSVAPRTACKMIDDGVIEGHIAPGTKNRRVRHEAILAHVAAHPEFKHVLQRIVTSEPK